MREEQIDTVFMYSVSVEWVNVIYVLNLISMMYHCKRNMILSIYGISAYTTKYISYYIFLILLSGKVVYFIISNTASWINFCRNIAF